MAIQLDGSTDYIVSDQNIGTAGGSGDEVVAHSWWVNFDQLPSTAVANMAVCYTEAASNTEGFRILYDDSYQTVTDSLRANYLDPIQSNYTWSGTGDITSAGTWLNHGATGGRLVASVEVWIDGTEETVSQIGNNKASPKTWNDQPMYIGANDAGAANLDGALAHYVVWDQAALGFNFRNAETQEVLFTNKFSPRFYEQYLKLYLPLYNADVLVNLAPGATETFSTAGTPTASATNPALIDIDTGFMFFAPGSGGGGGGGGGNLSYHYMHTLRK